MFAKGAESQSINTGAIDQSISRTDESADRSGEERKREQTADCETSQLIS